MADDTIEVPCVICGNAAARVRLLPVLDLIPKKILFTIKGAMRFAGGKSIDTASPSLGLDPADISEAIEATCISCVDAPRVAPIEPGGGFLDLPGVIVVPNGWSVDNKPGEAQ